MYLDQEGVDDREDIKKYNARKSEKTETTNNIKLGLMSSNFLQRNAYHSKYVLRTNKGLYERYLDRNFQYLSNFKSAAEKKRATKKILL